MRSHGLWTSCAILVVFAFFVYGHTNDVEDGEDDSNAYRQQRRNRLVAARTARLGGTVSLRQMSEMDGTTSRSSELIRQFIPFGKLSTQSSARNHVICPDKESFCPDETTCCPMVDDDIYGCCPAPEAVCCEDHIHCCPNGMTCDTQDEMCKAKDDSSTTSRMLRKIPSSRLGTDIVCPDKKSSCPEEATCCQDESGRYACCPAPDAVCCNDHVHCCPNGMTCNLEDLTCNLDNSMTSRLLRKVPAKKFTVGNDVACPDNKSSCPEETTCCQSQDGSYGCCPAPNAVCCEDHIHCCPNGMKCDTEDQQCKGDDKSIVSPFLRKFPTKRVVRKIGVQTTSAHRNCAGSQAVKRSPFYCPNGSSCCMNDMLNSASCCPHADGECCSNGECCPHGFRCTDFGNCMTKSGLVTTTPKLLFEATKEKLNAYGTVVTICGDNSECAGHSTCCPVVNAIDGSVQSYRCCGLSRATCCGVDADFCCPQGYTCARGRHCERIAPADIFTKF